MNCPNGHILSGAYCKICQVRPEKSKPKPIKKVSDKLKRGLEVYSVNGTKFMQENPICQYEGCKQKSEQLHHKRGRGVNLNNKETWMAICAEHHYFIHHISPKIAKEKGYL